MSGFCVIVASGAAEGAVGSVIPCNVALQYGWGQGPLCGQRVFLTLQLCACHNGFRLGTIPLEEGDGRCGEADDIELSAHQRGLCDTLILKRVAF